MVTFIDNAELQITQNKWSLFLGRIVYCHIRSISHYTFLVTFIDNAELQITQNKWSLFLGRIVYCHSGIGALLLRSEYMNVYHECVPYKKANYVSDRPIRRSQNLIINTIDSRLWYLGVKHRKQYLS